MLQTSTGQMFCSCRTIGSHDMKRRTQLQAIAILMSVLYFSVYLYHTTRQILCEVNKLLSLRRYVRRNHLYTILSFLKYVPYLLAEYVLCYTRVALRSNALTLHSSGFATHLIRIVVMLPSFLTHITLLYINIDTLVSKTTMWQKTYDLQANQN